MGFSAFNKDSLCNKLRNIRRCNSFKYRATNRCKTEIARAINKKFASAHTLCSCALNSVCRIADNLCDHTWFIHLALTVGDQLKQPRMNLNSQLATTQYQLKYGLFCSTTNSIDSP
jgi:hypothetical protein